MILICAALGACASTQKSGAGAGVAEQPAAPISDAPKSEAAGAQSATDAPTAAAPSSDAAAASSGSSDAGTDAAATAGSAAAANENEAVQATNEEAAQLKRQLEDQDAQINKLRTDQQAAAREEEAARQAQEQQQAAAASQASQAPAAAAGSSVSSEAAEFPPDVNAAGRAAASAGEAAAAPAGTLERSVYFDYDQAKVLEKYDAMLVANAAYLKAHPSLRTEVQGNCDERGSREYNLALGARRAEAVKRALELAGADGRRISVVSFGAEKPIALGKDEESYSKNRRADIVY
ncbi:MAG TPA: peptidoglycan-associated lipoprotein Pal [Burkholderiales bacterium]|nr:peptidoglycan-associated lipoprotein Pal [Burkholderiales bacterium]